MDRISVIIPTYNRGRLVKRAIQSVLDQTLAAGQIIVVDDGSSDDTLNVCREFGSSIEYVYQPNGGVSSARNRGIRLARHSWTAFLDSDDHWSPNHLASIAAACDATAGRALIYFTDMLQFDELGRSTLWQRIGFNFPGPYLLKEDGTSWVLSKREPLSIQSSMFQTQLLKACGGFNPLYQVSEDRELFFRLAIGGAICAVNVVGCVQTADAFPALRLGGMVHTRSISYWIHEYRLWSETLARFPALGKAERKAMCYGIALSHWRMTRLHWYEGHIIRGCRSLLRSVTSQPAFLFWLVCHGRSDKRSEKILPPCRAV